jgi:hypothetical protein
LGAPQVLLHHQQLRLAQLEAAAPVWVVGLQEAHLMALHHPPAALQGAAQQLAGLK